MRPPQASAIPVTTPDGLTVLAVHAASVMASTTIADRDELADDHARKVPDAATGAAPEQTIIVPFGQAP